VAIFYCISRHELGPLGALGSLGSLSVKCGAHIYLIYSIFPPLYGRVFCFYSRTLTELLVPAQET